MKKKFVGYIALTFFIAPLVTSCQENKDFDIMLNTYRDYLVEKTKVDAIIEEGSTALYNRLSKTTMNGIEALYYPEIDYNDGYPPNSWEVANHIGNAFKCAVAAVKTNDQKFHEIAIGLTYYWIYNDFRSTNWWWNDLGAGASLTNVSLFIFYDLTIQGKAALRARIARTSFLYRPGLLNHTGANLIDYADNTLKAAIINRDPKELDIAIKRIEEEVTDDKKEGFQKDGSFFQHGIQLQTMSNYGRSVMRIARILHIISKTKYRFSTEKLKIITNFVLRGIASGTFKGYSNYSEVAREYCRDDETMKAETYFDLDYFLELPNLPDKEKYKTFIDNLKNHQPTFEGMMYFDNAKIVTMNLDGLYMSFKGTNSDIINTECVNGENKLGLNLSYGTNTCVMDEGDEYYHISPIWDYAYIPGTTSIQMAPLDEPDYLKYTDITIEKSVAVYKDGLFEGLLPKATEANGFVYSSGFDEANQIAYFMQRSQSHEENNFTVTCIATLDGMFLMGADLDYTGEKTGTLYPSFNPALHTTLEQCHYKGSYELKDDNKTLIHGNAMYKVHDDHNIIVKDGYHSPDKEVIGHWRRNKNPEAKDKQATGKILLAYIDTETNNKYAYSIQPKSYSERKFELIHNFDGNKVQEVKLPNGKVVIAPYEDVMEYTTSLGTTIQLTKGQVVIL